MPYLRFDVEALPEIGSRLIVDRKASTGRCAERVLICAHKLIDWNERERRDGSAGVLMTWASECAECGRGFEQITGSDFKGFNRRCAECRLRTPRLAAGFPTGPRNRYVLYGLGEYHPAEVDPASLF